MSRALVLLILVACGEAKKAAGTAVGTVAEYIACPVVPDLNCGHVFVCGESELCIDDDEDDKDDLALAESLYGACEPTERHQGICRWTCPPETGCNAFASCFCPEAP